MCLPVVTLATPRSLERNSDNSFEHKCIMPSVQPNAQSSCSVEAAAYAAAIVALTDAQRVASEAYRRWYECECRRESPAAVEPAAAGPSVLLGD
jgi:hypothetical protein